MIEYEKRAMIEAEDKYTFRQSTQISMQTGLIGHLRADMDTDGNGFFSSFVINIGLKQVHIHIDRRIIRPMLVQFVT